MLTRGATLRVHQLAIHVKFTILHEYMDRTGDVAVDQERARLIGGKRHVTTCAGTKGKTAEVVLYRKPVRLDCVIVYDMKRNASPKCDIHYGPRAGLELAPVEPDIHPFIGHYNDEVGGAGRHACGTGPTVCCSETEEMKRVRRCEKSRYYYPN